MSRMRLRFAASCAGIALAIFCLNGCNKNSFGDSPASVPRRSASAVDVQSKPATRDFPSQTVTSELMDAARRAAERHFANMEAGNWAAVLDGSWFAPEPELMLCDPANRERYLQAMRAEGPTVQLGFKGMTVEVRLSTPARGIQGGKILIVRVDASLVPKPGFEALNHDPPTTACVSTDYGKTWKVAASLADVLKVYPER